MTAAGTIRLFSLSSSFLDEYRDKQPEWGYAGLGYVVYKRCVHADTPVLCADLSWKPAGSLSVGEQLLAFEEGSMSRSRDTGRPRHMLVSTVTDNSTELAECVKITLSNGDVLTCTPDHSWLVRTGYGLEWVEAKDLLSRKKCEFVKYADVWAEDTSYEAGYLAGAFDGEGSLDRKRSLQFVQTDNAMLSAVQEFLLRKGYKFSIAQKQQSKLGKKPCFALSLHSNAQVMRFLGEVRPHRLLEKYITTVDTMAMRRKYTHVTVSTVVSVEPVGPQPVAILSTTSKTHITAGYPSHNTYARTKEDGSLEEFWETCQRVVEGTYNVQKRHCHQLKLPWDDRKAQRSAQEMFRRMWEFKWLPPGRGLWMMGTQMVDKIGSGALNNCFSGDTEAVVFDDDLGLTTVPLRDLVGREFNTPLNSGIARATVKSFGEQELNHVTFKVPGKSKYVLEYDVTADHRWILSDGTSTTSLKVGDRVTVSPRTVHSSFLETSTGYKRGYAHGLIYGDGTRHTYYPERHFIRLCGNKEQAHVSLLESMPEFLSTTRPASFNGDAVVTLKLNKGENWKQVPDNTKDVAYCRGFIDGWLAADGHTEANGRKQLDSINLDGIQWLTKLAPTCGYVVTGWSVDNADTNFGPRSQPLNRVTLSTSPVDLLVQSISPIGKQEVFCAVVPDANKFVLAGGLETGNCGYVSTADIHVDFAEPFCWLMDMLMLGVGIGFDTKGAGKVKIQKPSTVEGSFVVEDSREGWVSLLRVVLNSFVGKGSVPATIDYSKVRPAGSPIKGFGGVASGPDPLKELIDSVHDILNPLIGEQITASAIVDISNLVGRCVVAGNVRRCLPAGTRVHTKKGLKPIEEVRVGDLVFTSKGWSAVTNTFDQGVQNVVTVHTQLGPLKATKNHQVKVFTSPTEFTFKKVEDLLPGDRLVFNARAQDYEQEVSLPSWSYEKSKHSTTCADINIPALDADTAWFLGLLAGDGYVYPNTAKNGFNAYVSVACSPDYPEITEDCQKVLKSFGVNLCDVLPSERDAAHKVRAQSKQLAWYLSQFKVAKQPMSVPECILSGSPELRAAYVAGLFDADGSTKTQPTQIATSVYPTYLQEVQAVLATLGIPSRFKLCRQATETEQALYALTVVGERAVERFTNTVGSFSRKFNRTAKTSRSQNDYGFPGSWISFNYGREWSSANKQMTVATYERIRNCTLSEYPVEVNSIDLENSEAAHTYDLEVSGVHEFVVESGLIVHNSAEIAFGNPDDEEFLNLKNPDINKEALYHHRWSSNNSVFAYEGMDYTRVAELTAKNGEPGYEWLDNARKFSRMGREPDYSDMRVAGANPCFSGDTLVAVADGRHAVPFKQLAEEGKDVPVYSLSPEGKVEIKWGRNPRKTREGAKLVRIHMDTGDYLDVTPDHKVILRDGTIKHAKDLNKGDSLPIAKKYKDKVVKDGGQYWRVQTDLSKPERVFEHRLVAKFFQPEKWAELYDEAKANGWIKGGVVVHHKDYNPLNNAPENLEVMTFKDHAQLHGDYDRVGEKNGMFGKSHSVETKAKIGAKTSERMSDPEFLMRLSNSHTKEERAQASARLKESKAEWDKEYYLEQERTTDLETVWVGDRMFAKKTCEHCGTGFTVPWGKRDRLYCSTACFNVYLQGLEARKNGQRTAFTHRQQGILHEQVMVYKDLQSSLSRDPMKKEWESACKTKNVSYRFRSGVSSSKNPYALTSFEDLKKRAAEYNHRVVRVEELEGEHDVYNITVETHHTVMVSLTRDLNASAFYMQGLCQCVEQSLEDRELCCLVETFPGRHESVADFQKTLKYAYLYAKTVTLIPTHDARTNTVLMRNRRIGCSMSGITQAIQKFGRRNFLNKFCDDGYKYLKQLDQLYSDWLCVRPSIKITSVKPSGSVSLLPGVTPGIHFPHAEYYVRRVRLQANSPLVNKLYIAGYPIEDDKYSPNTKVATFPVREANYDRSKDQVTMWEQLELAAALQQYWADNQVSVTVTFNAQEAKDIKYALELYETRLKGVSFLPLSDHGYEQAPYETITKEQYEAMVKDITPLSAELLQHEQTTKFCDGESCTI